MMKKRVWKQKAAYGLAVLLSLLTVFGGMSGQLPLPLVKALHAEAASTPTASKDTTISSGSSKNLTFTLGHSVTLTFKCKSSAKYTLKVTPGTSGLKYKIECDGKSSS